jgi:hypothetical protein
MSAVPCVHRTGGLGDSPTTSSQRQYLGDSALRIPVLPGAMPGQFSDVVRSPGYPPSPMFDSRISSMRIASRSGGSRWSVRQYDALMTLRMLNGESESRSPSRSAATKCGEAPPPPEPA